MSDENPNAFKHHLGPDAVARIAADVAAVHPSFDRRAFSAVTRELGPLELKQRVERIAEVLWETLALPFPAAAEVLAKTTVTGFAGWPLVRIIGRYGVGHRAAALAALRVMTERSSGEFDVRPFLVAEPEATLAELTTWVVDPNEHVRRLVSEGTRSRLPWGLRLHAFVVDPTPVLPLLEALRHDPAEYVRRSVANNLNDIAKDHPDLVITTAKRWLADGVERPLVERALRSLVKAGRADALAALGHGDAAGLEVRDLKVPKRVTIGEHLTLDFVLENTGARRSIVVDYAIHYLGARGEPKAPKVFKLKNVQLERGASLAVSKRHAMRHVSIRRLVPGTHRVDIQANGVVLAGQDFELVA